MIIVLYFDWDFFFNMMRRKKLICFGFCFVVCVSNKNVLLSNKKKTDKKRSSIGMVVIIFINVFFVSFSILGWFFVFV